MKLPCPSDRLIPQEGKMGLGVILNKAVFGDGEGSVIIRTDNMFLNDIGQLSNVVLIEYLNQLVAAIQGYTDRLQGKEKNMGFFVGVQEADFFQTVQAGDELVIKGFLTEKVSQVSFISGNIERKGQKIAQLVTKIFEFTDQLSLGMPLNGDQAAPGKNQAFLNKDAAPAHLSSSMRRKMHSYLNGLQITEDSIGFNIAYPESFDAYDGHFPGNPILPGIVLLETGLLALEMFTKKKVILKRVNKLKINGAVFPGQSIFCQMKIDKISGDTIDFSAAFHGEKDRPIARYSGLGQQGI